MWHVPQANYFPIAEDRLIFKRILIQLNAKTADIEQLEGDFGF